MSKFTLNELVEGFCLECKKDIIFKIISVKTMKGKGKKVEIYFGECPICLLESIQLIVQI